MTTTTIAGKFRDLDTVLNGEIFERQKEIHGHLLALVGGTTCFTIGPPGVAKTMLPLRLAKYIGGGEFFDITVNSFTQPEDFFGPQSITALKADRFERLIEGTLATAHWGMVDEIFKAYKVLTSLLRLLNEGTYKHGTETRPAPLTTLFTMSNEMPRGEDLEALYDRLLLRFEVSAMKDPANLVKILDPHLPENPIPLLGWSEVEAAQKSAREVELPTDVLEAAVQISRDLHTDKINPSNRRLARSMILVRAAAWLDECDVADLGHLSVLQHTLWHDPNNAGDVARVVNKVANPLDNKIMDLLADVGDMEDLLAKGRLLTDEDDRMNAGTELETKMNRTTAELRKLKRRARSNKGRSFRIEEVSARLLPLVVAVMTEFYHFDSAQAATVANNTVRGNS